MTYQKPYKRTWRTYLTEWRWYLGISHDGMRYCLARYVAKYLHAAAIWFHPDTWDCHCDAPHCDIDLGRRELCLERNERQNDLRLEIIRESFARQANATDRAMTLCNLDLPKL